MSTVAHGEGLEHADVLIVGAGLSGIGAAHHLQAACPGTSYAILEARAAIGGTWDLFRYPGIRSDSDMFTLGYAFRPWQEAKAIADGPSILSYIRETAREGDIERRIRFGQRVVGAAWSSDESRWTVEAERADTGERVRLTCGFLFFCSGYYRYDHGYVPDFRGTERFAGRIVHPQRWTDDIDYDGKRVVVIGSGATAVTLVPAIAEQAAHVTMLQRSPTYVVAVPERDPIADAVRGRLPARVAYPIVRVKNILLTTLVFQLSRRAPRFVKGLIRRGLERQLPDGYDIDTHFTPRYDPWDQRMCLVPGRGSVHGDPCRTREHRHRRDRDLHRARAAAHLRRRTRGRPDRHRDGARTAGARRGAALGGRPRGRAAADRRLQGDDAQRRPESGHRAGLHERVVDAEVRSDLRVRLPAAESHAGARVRAMRRAR